MDRVTALIVGVLLFTLLVLALVRLGRGAPPRRRGPQSHWNVNGSAKTAYRSRAAAQAAARRHEHDFGQRMGVYECERGGHFHYGHLRPPGRRTV